MITRDPTALLPETLLVFTVSGEIQNLANALKAIPGLELVGEDLEEEIADAEEDGDDTPVEDDGENFLYLMLPNQSALSEIERLWRHWEDGDESAFSAPIRNLFDCLKSIRRWSAQDRVSATDAAALSALVLDQPAAPIAVEIELVFRESAAQALVARQMVTKAVADVGGKVLHVSRHPQFSSDAMLVELPAAHVDLIVQRSEDSLAGLEPIIAIGPQTSISMSSAAAELHEVYAPDQRPGREPLAALFDAVPHLTHDLLVERMQFDDPAGLDAISIGHRLHGTAMASLIIHGDLNDLDSFPITRPLYVRPVMYARHANSSEEVFPQNRLVVDDFYDAVVRMKEGSADVPPSAPTVIIVNVSLGDSRRRFAGRLSRWARAIDELSWRYGILFVVSAGNLDLTGLDDLPIPGYADKASFEAAPVSERQSAILKGVASSIRDRSLLAPSESINALTVGALNKDLVSAKPRRGILPYEAIGSLPNPSSAPGLGYARGIKPDILMPGGQERILAQGTSSGITVKTLPFDSAHGLKAAIPPATPSGSNSMASPVGQTSAATALASRTAHRLHDVLEQAYGQSFLTLSGRHRALALKALLVHGARWTDVAGKIDEAFGTGQHWQHRRANVTRLLGYGAVDEANVLYCTKTRATAWTVGSIPKTSASVVTLPLPESLAGKTVPKSISATLTWFSPTAPGRRTYKSTRLVLADIGEDDMGRLGIEKSSSQPDVNATRRGTIAHRVFRGPNAAALVTNDGLQFRIQREKDSGAIIDDDIAFAIAVTVETSADLAIYEEVAARLSIKPTVSVAPPA